MVYEDCGGFYGKKKWHSTSKYSRFIYQCNKKFHRHKEKCQTQNLTEEDIKLKFIKAYNLIIEDREMMIQDEVINLLTDTTKLDKDLICTSDELTVIGGLVNKLVKENSKTSMSQEEFNKKYQELSNRDAKTKAKYDELKNTICHRKG